MIAKYFGPIPAAKLRRSPTSASRRSRSEMASRKDALANPPPCHRYHNAAAEFAEYYAMGLLDQMLAQGDDSLLYSISQKRGFTGSVSGGINAISETCSIIPSHALDRFAIYDPNVKRDKFYRADSVIEGLQSTPVDGRCSAQRTKLRSNLYDSMTQFGLRPCQFLAASRCSTIIRVASTLSKPNSASHTRADPETAPSICGRPTDRTRNRTRAKTAGAPPGDKQ